MVRMNEIKKRSVLVIFSGELSKSTKRLLRGFDVVVAPLKLQIEIESRGCAWVNLDDLVEAGSIYEASVFVDELARLAFPNGIRVAKSFEYDGYELWWMNYQNLYTRFCLPYTQYRKLLEYLTHFQNISFYRPPFNSLFSCYLRAYGCTATTLKEFSFKGPAILPFGMVVQIFLTLLFLPALILRNRHLMVFTGDKFEATRDYDFRMKFIYAELRERNLPFVEFVRSLGTWKTILQHAYIRKRPVIYSEAVTFIGRFLSGMTGGHRRARREFGDHLFTFETDSEKLFKFMVAHQYLLTVYDDIWSIRIMKWILKVIGVKASFIAAAAERNFHTVIGCKQNAIPTVGILHGAQSYTYNVYDFMPSFDGEKMLSVDRYGLWSEWWKEYYIKYSRAYRPEQFIISGPMRPIQKTVSDFVVQKPQEGGKIKVLFVSEIVAVPEEVVQYLDALNAVEDFSVYIKFRSNGDRFETWLTHNRPDILSTVGERVLKGTMQEAIAVCDVVVGSQSTGVIEATLQDKPFVFFSTKKWGDYFDMQTFDERYHFFAHNTQELSLYIRESNMIPPAVLKNFCTRFFGDPYQNGSQWVVEQLEKNYIDNVRHRTSNIP